MADTMPAERNASGTRRFKRVTKKIRKLSLPAFRSRSKLSINEERERRNSIEDYDDELWCQDDTDMASDGRSLSAESADAVSDRSINMDTISQTVSLDLDTVSRTGSLDVADDTSSTSSQQVAKSAPSTPQGDRQAQPQYQQQLPTPQTPQTPRSPGHSFGRHDRQVLKQLSVSAPVMTHHQASSPRSAPSELPAVVTPADAAAAEPPGSSKSRQKKFHRHFKQVAPEEHVLNYYSCALVGDILLQGHLYITKNYFAFYSNVFGYVTKLLIPTVSVIKISKEKTARIIPNAVGVATEDEKHVFGSLLSRDSTHRLMTQVWKAARAPNLQANLLPIEQVIKDEVDSASGDIKDDDDSSISGSDRSCPPTPLECATDISHSEISAGCAKLPNGSLVVNRGKHIKLPVKSSPKHSSLTGLPRSKLLLLISTGLLILLFLSAAYLLYRICRIHNQFVENTYPGSSDDVYQEILKWQTQLHSRSANEVQEFLNSNLDQLAKVRQSLEALSLLIEAEHLHQQRDAKLQGRSGGSTQQTPTLPHDKHS